MIERERRGGIGVITNPRSGQNRRNPQLMGRLAYLLGERGQLALPDGLDRLEAWVTVFRERDIDVLCVNGGDGTLHQVMTALVKVYGDHPLPMIALLKGGTMNTVARNVGIKQSAEELLSLVVGRYHNQQPFATTERNLLIVDGNRAGFIFGNGGIAHFLEAYYDGGDASPWKAAKLLTRCVLSALVRGEYTERMFRHLPMRITADGTTIPNEQFTILGIATVADLGFGFRPFYQVLHHPDHLHLIGIACHPFHIATSMPRIRLALPTARPDIHDHVVKQVRVESTENLGYTIDGDLYPGEQVTTLEVGPRVRFIVG